MSTAPHTADYILEQLSALDDVRTRRMFGEYALYVCDKVVAFICDDQLFLKPLPELRPRLREVIEAPPYPGAKNYFRIDDVDDREYLSRIVQAAADALPLPQPKKRR